MLYHNNATISNDEGNTLYAILHNDITIMAAPPILLSILRVHKNSAKKLRKFRLLISGGAGLSKEGYDWYKRHHINLINGYGMTECVAVVGLTGNSDNKKELEPLDWCDIKLAEDGELLIKGEGVCETYMDGTKIPDIDGW